MARDGDDPDAPASPFFFIIGDTSYGACCADEVAAQHLNADAIVHYGPTCLSPTARLPVIHVFGRRVLRPDPQAVAASIAGALRRQNEEVGGADPVARALLFYDLGYAHAVPELGRLLGALLADDGVEVVVASLPSGALEGKEEEDGSGSSSSSSAPQQQQQQEQGRGTVVAGGLQVSLPDDGGEEKRTRTAVAYIGVKSRDEGGMMTCLSVDPSCFAPRVPDSPILNTCTTYKRPSGGEAAGDDHAALQLAGGLLSVRP